jgi:hypothetical protein
LPRVASGYFTSAKQPPEGLFDRRGGDVYYGIGLGTIILIVVLILLLS